MKEIEKICRNSFEGCMLGIAIGDALGMPCEDYEQPELFKTFGRITDYLDPPKGQFNYGKLKAGMYTDDTEQAIILAESLVEKRGFDANHFANKLLGEYGRRVIEHPELDRWIGGTFKKAIKNYISGLPATKRGAKAKSCGSAMRVAPIGLVYSCRWGGLPLAEKFASESSKVTHIGAETTAAAEAVASYVSLAGGQYSVKDICDIVSEDVERESKIIAKRIKKAYEIKDAKPEKAVKILGNSQLARETVPLAIYSFNKYPLDFENAVLTSVNAGGDTDSIASITGTISGAFNGRRSIPNRWIEKLENKEKLIDLGNKLYDIANSMILVSK